MILLYNILGMLLTGLGIVLAIIPFVRPISVFDTIAHVALGVFSVVFGIGNFYIAYHLRNEE